MLLKIDLGSNGIKTNGDKCIPDFLSTNPPIKELSLNDNRLDDNDAFHIGEALLSNTQLRLLNLRGNALTKKGKRVTRLRSTFGISPPDISALQSISDANLNAVSRANHTCKIQGISNQVKNLFNDGHRSAKVVRGMKLFSLIWHRHREDQTTSQLQSEFLDEGVKLVPHVMACINTYAAKFPKRKCLSVLFELARDWKTPEMYQLRHSENCHAVKLT
ncbi:hypothetical protein THAOC_16693 [Thalassiosira oceanica]|uniref:Uncharacterized protein n=1 Tax=Thalassiosira oceanica TaxID=159749 RepID=K0SBN4_THAOC|nr:hypothetical protein THAOC_16693 [Thalassiosira oceanica]|eukprot:EJK62685.1 hypothetical protein THAOC_16693 [Thalassiosira oceanica]